MAGKACALDHPGSQACKAPKEARSCVALQNSNPATIMADPSMAAAICIEPSALDYTAAFIQVERAGAVLPAMDGQTPLNCATRLCPKGTPVLLSAQSRPTPAPGEQHTSQGPG